MTDSSGPRDHLGRPIDFGRTAEDYDRHRPGYPRSLFERLDHLGWIRRGSRALDLGAGTGAMALELVKRGLTVTALDRSPELLAVLARRASDLALDLRIVQGVAEDTKEPAASHELVTASQCWWWFDAPRALQEIRRLLVPDGRALIASFSYLALPGGIAHASEALVLAHNPGWIAANSPGIFPEQADQLAIAGFADVETFSYDVDVTFTHEGWAGRMRACNGVAASLSPEEVARFDADLREMLARDHPSELIIRHRVFVATGVAPPELDDLAPAR